MDEQQLLALLDKVFPQYLEARFGVSADQLNDKLATIDDLYAQQAQSRIDRIIGLQGDELERGRKLVQDYFEKLPPGEQQRYDNELGVEFIWNKVRDNINVPDGSLVDGEAPATAEQVDTSNPNRVWKRSEIFGLMGDENYETQWKPVFEKAYQEGRVRDDSPE